MRQDPEFQNIFGTKKMSNQTERNLSSIITRPVQPGDERSCAANTTIEDEDMLAQKVTEMLSITIYKNGEVNEEDLAYVVKNTEILLKQSFGNHAVKTMYTSYQNMWTVYVAKHDIKDEYNDVMLVSFFDSINGGYAANTPWVIYSCIKARFIDRFGLNLNGLPRLKKYLKQKTNKHVAKKPLTFNAEEIQEILLTLQDKKDDPYATLY